MIDGAKACFGRYRGAIADLGDLPDAGQAAQTLAWVIVDSLDDLP